VVGFGSQRRRNHHKVAFLQHDVQGFVWIKTVEVIPLWVSQSFRNIPIILGMHDVAFCRQHLGSIGIQQPRDLPPNGTVPHDPHCATAQFNWFQFFYAMLMPNFLLLKTEHLRSLMPQHQQSHYHIFAHLAHHCSTGAGELYSTAKKDFLLEGFIHSCERKLYPLQGWSLVGRG